MIINSIKRMVAFFQEPKTAKRDYTKYIILGYPRTGTNMLRGMLNENPHVVAFGELFRFTDSIGWDYPGYDPEAKRDMHLFNHDPIRFLQQAVFSDFPLPVLAVGFKIFYFHAHNENWEPVWSYLQAQKDIKIIHIKRENLLKIHLSLTRATASKTWIKTTNKPHDEPPIPLEYKKCLYNFKKIKQYEAQYDNFFNDHEKLELIYENMTASYPLELKRITDFLGVPYKKVTPVTFQQARKPLSESIANYRELKEQFQGTPWEKYFEEQ